MTDTSLAERRTRQRILEAGIDLLAKGGLAHGLLEHACAAAGYPAVRAELYFQRDEDLVLALYLRLASELEARAADLPAAALDERFRAVMQTKLALVAPYRDALAALVSSLIDPRHELGALGGQMEIVRRRVMGVFSVVVLGASDAPKTGGPEMVRTLYGAHLALMLLWTQDRTAENAATRNAIDFVCKMLAVSGRISWMPGLKDTLEALHSAVAPFVEPEPDNHATELATRILRRLFRHRRLHGADKECAKNPCDQCLALHLPKLRGFIIAGQPIQLLLPAFPAKSPNPRKVIGALPDMAEELALEFLEGVCRDVGELYPPGARITICSDGRVFSDLVGVSDANVSAYGEEIGAVLQRLGSQAIDLFHMEDLFEVYEHPAMREQLCVHYAESLAAIEERTHKHEHHRALFNGIQRFLFEDRVVLETEKSRTQVRNECKELAYQVVRRSDAWGRLIGECFPTALRLSIHPQHPHSEKIGFLLGDAEDVWLTPWHGVAVKREGGFTLMRRSEAEALGARLIERSGRPSHYETREAL